MTTAVTIAPSPILSFLDNNGRPCVGGTVLTQVGGVNAATYQDSAGTIPLPNPIPLNSRGEVSNASGVSCQLFLPTGVVYTFTLFDAFGNQLNQASYVQTSNILAQLANPSNGSGADLVAGVGRIVTTIAALRALAKSGTGNAFVLGYYTPGDGGGGQYFYNVSDTTSSDNGGSIIVAADGGRWYLDLSQPVSIRQFGCIPGQTAAVQTTTLNAALATFPQLYAPQGQYTFNGTVTLQQSQRLYGDGVPNSLNPTTSGTHFGYTGTGTFLSFVVANETSLRAPLYLQGIAFDGGTAGSQIGLVLTGAHDYSIRDCVFDNFGTGVQVISSYLGEFQNVASNGCTQGFFFEGDANRVSLRSCSIVGFTAFGVRVVNTGGLDTFGSLAFEMSNTDIEFGNGSAFSWEAPQSATLLNCYMGDGMAGNTFNISQGVVNVIGGLAAYGQQGGVVQPLVNFPGAAPTDERRLVVSKAVVGVGSNAFGTPAAQQMVSGTASSGKIIIRDDCQYAVTPNFNGGPVLMTGDPLGYAPGMNALVTPNGLGFSTNKTGTATFTATPQPSSNSLFLTATNTVVDGSVIYANQALTPNKLVTSGAAVCMVVVYKSNSAWSGLLDSGAFNTTPTANLGVMLPNTGGALATAVFYNQVALAASYTNLDLFRANCTTGDFLEIHEVFLFDSRQGGSVGSLFCLKNLYKPI